MADAWTHLPFHNRPLAVTRIPAPGPVKSLRTTRRVKENKGSRPRAGPRHYSNEIPENNLGAMPGDAATMLSEEERERTEKAVRRKPVPGTSQVGMVQSCGMGKGSKASTRDEDDERLDRWLGDGRTQGGCGSSRCKSVGQPVATPLPISKMLNASSLKADSDERQQLRSTPAIPTPHLPTLPPPPPPKPISGTQARRTHHTSNKPHLTLRIPASPQHQSPPQHLTNPKSGSVDTSAQTHLSAWLKLKSCDSADMET